MSTKNNYQNVNKSETEKMLKRLVHVSRINERIKEANEQTEIGYLYHKLRYNTVMDDGIKPISELNIDDVVDLLHHIDWMLNEHNMNEENIEDALQNITVHIPVYESAFNQGSFLFTKCTKSKLAHYLKHHCCDIEDEELFHYDKASDKILVCNDRWLMAHFKFILKTIYKLEHLKLHIETGGDAEKMEQIKKDKRKQVKNEQANERIECGCTMWYSKSNKTKHENTKYHKEWVEEGCPYRESSGIDPETMTEEERKKLMEMKMDEYIECECGQGYARKDKQHHVTSSFHRGYCKAVKAQSSSS